MFRQLANLWLRIVLYAYVEEECSRYTFILRSTFVRDLRLHMHTEYESTRILVCTTSMQNYQNKNVQNELQSSEKYLTYTLAC
jgi:hypothetical protein